MQDPDERHSGRRTMTPSPLPDKVSATRQSRHRERQPSKSNRASRHSRASPKQNCKRRIQRDGVARRRRSSSPSSDVDRSHDRTTESRGRQTRSHHSRTVECQPSKQLKRQKRKARSVSTSRSSSQTSDSSHKPRRKRRAASIESKFMDRFIDALNNKKGAAERYPVLNVIPEFDPMCREQTIDTWLHKVEECAEIYEWSQRQTAHYALPKLCGVAKTWYQGLPSVLHTWSEWKSMLYENFPARENYHELLIEMIKKKAPFGQPLEIYYYDKLNLLNRCNIHGRNAVDCLVAGIEDRGIRLSAQSGQFLEPEQLLKFFKSIKVGQGKIDSSNDIKNKDTSNNIPSRGISSSTKKTIRNRAGACFNCNEMGHTYLSCSKPELICTKCGWRGHQEANCTRKLNRAVVASGKAEVMEVTENTIIMNKYKLPIKINNQTVMAHVDLGSDCTLIRCTDAQALHLAWQDVQLPILKGLGNIPYTPLGRTHVSVDVQGILEHDVEALIVEDHLISHPVLLGHTYTERPTITIIKTASDLIIRRHKPEGLSKNNLKSIREVFMQPVGTTLVNVSMDTKYTGRVYVNGTVRGRPNERYYLLPGEYELIDGQGKLIVQNLENRELKLASDTLITRARCVTASEDHYVSVSEVEISNDTQLLCGDIKTEQRQRLVDLLNKYKSCFSSGLHDLGFTTATEMEINLKDNEPVVYRPYRLSAPDRSQVRGMVQDMLDNGIVRESSSPYASPIVLVQKKTGEKRLCVDYRALNNKTVKEHFPLPRIEDQLDLLAGNTMFIALDLASGYYQIPIAEESKKKTAFVTPDGQFEYNRMPFGLVNAPSVFQRTINKILNEARIKYALVYMDDVLIPARNFDEALLRLEEVLKLLRDGGLTLKLDKCKFCFEKIDYLGFEISAEGIRPGANKTRAVAEFPVPKNQHDVRRFLGLASFFRRFVKGFAMIANPLTSLLKKDNPWKWGKEEQYAFESLRDNLIQRPVLALYNHGAETQLHTDASKMGVAGILIQKNDAGIFQPVAYYSRQTTKDEQKLHSFELETLAVVASLNKFRVYLLGIHFKIFSDCNALRTTLTKRDLVPRIARWWIQFQEFDCTIEYRPGERMSHVDALSRHPILDTLETDRTLDILTVSSGDWIATVQDNDEEIRKIKDILTEPEADSTLDILRNYKLKNGRIFRIISPDVLRWVVPKGARWQILRNCHDNVGHFGFDKTLERIRATYWFPKMRRFVKKYVNACLECAHHKQPGGAQTGPLHPIPKVDVPFHTIHADHLGPFNKSKRGNNYILVIVDAFTKFVNLTAVRDTRASTSVRVLKEHISYFGAPTRLITDQGTSFTGIKFKDYVKTIGVKHVYNAVATPRANGQVERYNRTILASLGAMTHEKPKGAWDDYLADVQLGINTSIHTVTKKTPSELLFGRRVTNPHEGILNDIMEDVGSGVMTNSLDEARQEAKRLIDGQQIKDKDRYDRRAKGNKIYKEGDLVRVLRAIPGLDGQSRKLEPKIRGPYRVKKVLPNDRYIIEDTPLSRKGKAYEGTFSSDKIYPWMSFSGNDDDSISSGVDCSEDDAE